MTVVGGDCAVGCLTDYTKTAEKDEMLTVIELCYMGIYFYVEGEYEGGKFSNSHRFLWKVMISFLLQNISHTSLHK